MNRTHTRRLVAAAALAGALFAVGGTSIATAAAPAPADLANASSLLISAWRRSIASMHRALVLARSAATLTDSHEATIDAFLSAASTGLAALKVEIEGDTEAADLREDCTAIAEDYRIFALRSPQVHLAIAGDREAAALDRADQLVARLQEAIDAAAAAGQDVTEATATMAHLQSALDHADATLPGVVDTLLTYTPSDWNANHSVLSPSTTAIRGVHADLLAAVADARAIVADLKD